MILNGMESQPRRAPATSIARKRTPTAIGNRMWFEDSLVRLSVSFICRPLPA